MLKTPKTSKFVPPVPEDSTDGLDDPYSIQSVQGIFQYITSDSGGESEAAEPLRMCLEVDSNDFISSTFFVQRVEAFSDYEFQMHLRMRRRTVDYLVSRYAEYAAKPYLCRNSLPRRQISYRTAVYMYLWYMGNVVRFRQLANLFGVSMMTAWRSVRQVTACIVKFGHEFIKWPQGADLKGTQLKFQRKKGIPDVVGAIDCYHIEIKAPRLGKRFYLNKRQTYSLVLQVVVDSKQKFIDVSCGDPGAMLDAEVLQKSALYKRAQENRGAMFPRNAFLLGDSDFPSASWLVTPFKESETLTESQRKFNEFHAATRSVVGDTFDLVKRRFPRVRKFTEKINTCATASIIMSACVLHNICLENEDSNETFYPFFEGNYGTFNRNPAADDLEDAGSLRREQLFNYLRTQNLI